MIIFSYFPAKRHVIAVFSSWSKHIFSHFSKLISQLTEAVVQVFLGKRVLKIRSKFKGEHPCRSAVSATLLKSYFSMDILLQTFCIFSKHLFIITHLEGCFWIQRELKGLLLNLTPRNSNVINSFKILKTYLIFKLLDEKLWIFLHAKNDLHKTTNHHKWTAVIYCVKDTFLFDLWLLCWIRNSSKVLT